MDASAVIEGEEIYHEEIPAELLERVSDNHPHLIEVSLQVKRGRWTTMKIGRQRFADQPPTIVVHDICTKIVEAARRDAEATGDNQKYRARLRCRQNDHEYSRYACVRGVLNDAGAFTIVDDGGTDEADPMRVLVEAKAQSDSVSFQCLQTVLAAVKGYASIADSFNKLLCAAGEVFTKNVSGQADLLRIQMEMEGAKHAHVVQMAKIDKGFGLLEGPVMKIGDEIVDHVVSGMRDKRAKGNAKTASGRPRPASQGATRSGFATTLDDVFANLDETKTKAARDVMSADEWKLIQMARNATTDQIFDGVFQRFVSLLKERGNEGSSKWISQIETIVGNEALMKLAVLIQRIENAGPTPAA